MDNRDSSAADAPTPGQGSVRNSDGRQPSPIPRHPTLFDTLLTPSYPDAGLLGYTPLDCGVRGTSDFTVSTGGGHDLKTYEKLPSFLPWDKSKLKTRNPAYTALVAGALMLAALLTPDFAAAGTCDAGAYER